MSTFGFNPVPKPGQREKPARKHISRSSSLRGKPVTSDEADEFLAAHYYPHVKSQPCARCKAVGENHAHHFSGIANPKQPVVTLKRGHTGLAKYAALPLCEACHRSAHEAKGLKLTERQWIDRNLPNGYAGALALSHRLLAEAALIATARALALQAESKAAA